MTEVIVFPDAAATIGYQLGVELGVDVVSRVPNPRTAEFLLVRRVGGVTGTLVTDNATLVVEAWSDSAAAAHDLLQLARAHLHALAGSVVGGHTVYRVAEIAGPADLPDPESNQARHTMTVQVSLRGAVTGS